MAGNEDAADPMIFKPTKQKRKKSLQRGGSETQFPGKLHDMITCVECQGLDSIVSWIKNGTAFMVHNPEKLLEILPVFFGQTKYRSFERQLNGWYFERILDGPDKGAFMHPYFVRGNKFMCTLMSRNFPPEPIPPTLMMNPVTDSTFERINHSNRTPRLLDYGVKPVEEPAHNDVSTSSDFAHFSKLAPTARKNLSSGIFDLSSSSKVGHNRGDRDDMSSDDLQAGSPNEKLLCIPPTELQDPTMMNTFIPTPMESRIFPSKLASPTLMMDPMTNSTFERINFSNWTPRLLDYSVKPIEKPANNDVSTCSDFTHFSKRAPTTRTNLSSGIFDISSNSKVGHNRGDCEDMSSDDLQAGSPRAREKARLPSLCIPPMELQDPTMMDAFIPTPIEEVSWHAGISEPASPEAIESIFRELSGFQAEM
jgi:hypothetical protein